MNKNKNQIWIAGLLAEGFLIVCSILIAFWLDAWWENRANQEDVNASFQSLLAEMRETESQLRI